MRPPAAAAMLLLAACSAPPAAAPRPAATGSAAAAPPPDPHLHLTWLISPADRDTARRMGTARITITAPGGAVTYDCTRSFEAAVQLAPSAQPCREAAHWMREPGDYEVHIAIAPRARVRLPELRHAFRADGDEIGFEAGVQLATKPGRAFEPFVQRFRFDRLDVTPPER